ncbi:MAG TPA: AAA family ATPase [Pyrinomonadaceae bacterium]|nr:AAA family ATPase [Pyrinomonadaceae bacterium]
MEAVIFIGVQGSGKSTFYKRKFYETHIRINLDMLRTRHRERLLVSACFEAKQKFVVDNTNPTAEDRQRYILPAKFYHFRVIGYYFRANLKDALRRNAQREGKARIVEKGVKATFGKLELPSYAEGFDELFYVWIDEKGEFVVEEWKREV